MLEKFYITTPIYYVNDVPHIGHAYTTIAADVLTKWNKLHNKKVFFLTGTDEHGSKIYEVAKKRNLEPKKHCDEMVKKFKLTWLNLNIEYNYFIRTTDENHIETVKGFLQELFNKNEIYKSKYKGLYCIQCEKFLTETELVNGKCPDHNIEPEIKSEENYFFKLSNYREKIIEILKNNSHPNHIEILPEERKNEILGKLNIGLDDISISRIKLPWGIPLTFDSNQTTYVWIDALLNYYTASKIDNFNYWPPDLHLMAKDILWFHAVIWPAMLMAMNLPLPKKLYAHGFFTVNGQKMSKTIGNVIQPEELIKEYGCDAVRYLLLSLFPFGTDGDINLELLKEKYNSNLANNLGNLISRTLTMIWKYSDGVIPQKNTTYNASLKNKLLEELKNVNKYFEGLEFSKIIDTLQKQFNLINNYINETSPWNLVKEKKTDQLNSVLYQLSELLWVISHYIYPFLPQTGQELFNLLGETKKITDTNFFINYEIPDLTGNRINKKILFPRK